MLMNFWGRRAPTNSLSKMLRRIANRLDTSAIAREVGDCNERIAARTIAVTPSAVSVAIIKQAWAAGKMFDLSDVGYGPAHWADGKQFHDKPFSYYFFLAGLVRSQDCKRIFEIGTHYGGSTYSMFRGISDPSGASIVTVDITDLNPALYKTPCITKLIGDANSEAVLKRAVLTMGEAPIDLLYVDASHEFMPTLTNLGLYVFLLQPKFVVIDDILLNEGMRSLWNTLCFTQQANAVNCVDIIPEIRSKEVGFGFLRLR